MGGGGFSMEPDNPLLDDFVLGLSAEPRPRICFLPTASGDAEGYVADFYGAFAMRAEASHLALFDRSVADIATFLLGQDVIYVGGGNTANMLAIWRVHGVDRVLCAAWEAGVVLAGLSAGAICWFESGTTDSFGPGLDVLTGGLTLLSGSLCPHYDGEPLRRPTYQQMVADGRLASGYGVDDGAALVFEGTELREVVASRPGAAAYRVELLDGSVCEAPLTTRYLGD